jgi:hypothetical protein
VLEFQKRRGTIGWERRLFPKEFYALHPNELVLDGNA